MSAIITVENLGKKYQIRHQQSERYTALRDVLARRAAGLFKRVFNKHDESPAKEDFWALKDVNFEVHEGEVLGIVGRNGAGKSTLLKILSRITEPTTGRIRLRGRVASLLEVGTGFHPELTGRENIYLNGAILGMTKEEIKGKFDEIVAFADIKDFLDTPVKRYSSGMYVRLAFAVAAHLDTEILIVDEVLAVGDAIFQKKCLGKFHDLTTSGRTVILVSHNMNVIENYCNKVLFLSAGKQQLVGDNVRGTIQTYLKSHTASSVNKAIWNPAVETYNNFVVKPIYFAALNSNYAEIKAPVRNDECVVIRIGVIARRADPSLAVGIALYNSDHSLLFWTFSSDPGEEVVKIQVGEQYLECEIPRRFLNEGLYRVELILTMHHKEWILPPGARNPTIEFEIYGGLSDSPYWINARPGVLAPVMNWKLIS